MKKTIAMLLVMAAALVSLTACSGKPAENTATEAPAEVVTEAPVEDATEAPAAE